MFSNAHTLWQNVVAADAAIKEIPPEAAATATNDGNKDVKHFGVPPIEFTDVNLFGSGIKIEDESMEASVSSAAALQFRPPPIEEDGTV